MLLVTLIVLVPALEGQVDRFGLPACSPEHRELATRAAFVLCFDGDRRVPAWTGYELKPEQLVTVVGRPNHFRHDSRLLSASGYDSDFRNSGWVRGHMVPAGDMRFSEASVQDAFLFSNVVPQDGGMNNGLWRRVENRVRRIAAASSSVIVFTGPIFDCPSIPRIGRSQIAVPCEIFKAVLAVQGNRVRMYAVIVPNTASADQGLSRYAVSVRELERRTGLDFFGGLEDGEQRRLESECNPLPAGELQ